QFLRRAEAQADTGPLVIGNRLLADTLFSLGELLPAQVHFAEALNRYDPARHRSLSFRYGHDQRTAALVVLAETLWVLGYPDRAERAISEGIAWAQSCGHANTLQFARVNGASLCAMRRDLRGISAYIEPAMSMAREHGMLQWLNWGNLYAGWVAAMQ